MEGSHGEGLICSKHLSAEWLSEGQGHRYVPFVFGVSVEKLGASRDHLVSSVCDKENAGSSPFDSGSHHISLTCAQHSTVY